jgi:lipoprotein-anchoring transpeptidase ErfK/SrfK
VVVTASGGKLSNVEVSAQGVKVDGTLTADGSRWESRWPLTPGKKYEVSARAEAGSTVKSSFTTLQPAQTIGAFTTGPQDGGKAGIGMPIILNFTAPVYNQAQVEKSLEVKMSEPVEGAWRWIGNRQVIFRPRKYWPAGEKVELIAHLNGVRAAKDTYGVKDVKYGFTIGDAIISTVNTKTYKMTVTRNGKVIRRMPISAGRATKRAYTTTNGVHLTMEKAETVVADSATVGIPKGNPEYYKLDLNWAVRISNSGEYVHSAPWSVGSQGHANFSHGCVNACTANAKWFYDLSLPGNVVVVTGTDRQLEWNNGWGYWQLPWKKWTSGSALNQPDTAPATPGPATG